MANKNKSIKRLAKVLALDISDDGIVAIEIQFVKNVVSITGGFRIDLPVFSDFNKSIEIVKQNLKLAKIKTKDLVIGYSMQYFKLFPMPIPTTIPDSEIPLIISQESGVDTSLDSFTYLPLKNTKRQDTDGVTRYDILGMTIPKNYIESASTLAKKCGLNLECVTASFLGLTSFLDPKPNSLIPTLGISKSYSDFVVWSGHEPIYENLMLTEDVVNQTIQTMNFIQGQIPGSQLSFVYSYGSAVYDVDLTQIPYNLKAFSLTQDITDPSKLLQKLTLSGVISALGLALCGSNNLLTTLPNLLHPIVDSENIFASKSKGPARSSAGKDPVLSRFMALATIIFLFSIFTTILVKMILLPGAESELSVVQNRLNSAQTNLARVSSYEKANKVFNMKIEYLSELIDKRIPWSEVVTEIAKVTPKHLWIDRLEIHNKKIDIFGRALDVDSVANFSINLNYTTKLLKNAQIISLKKYEEDNIDYVEFQLSLSINDNITNIIKQNLTALNSEEGNLNTDTSVEENSQQNN